jgi:glycine betaine/proline transport system substrate-binding protein
MKKYVLTAIAGGLLTTGSAYAECGDVTLAAFSWQSAEVNAYVDQFILENGYGCNASVVAGDTVPTMTSMIEKGQPDMVSAVAVSLLGDFYKTGVEEGRVVQIGLGISDGSVSGWYIPTYVAEAHPEIKTVEDAIAHPELFTPSNGSGKGVVIQGPQGWGDTVVAAQLFKALDAENKGWELLPTGSAAALDGEIAKDYEQQQGFIATYWAPTSLLVKYPMVLLQGEHDAAEYGRCTTVQDCPDPKVNYWQAAVEATVASKGFADRMDPAVKDYLGKRSWTQAEVGKIMLWMTENQANGEEGARWFFENMPDLWTTWVPADVAEKIKAAL